MSWNVISEPRLIEPSCEARSKASSPLKVSVPPGRPEVISPTLINARLGKPRLLRSMVGLPASSNDVNLKAAAGKWPALLKWVSKPSAVSTAAVETKTHREHDTRSTG